MPLPSLPTASEIRIASRLRPEQVSTTLANEAALELDIVGRITEQASYVEMRIGTAAAPRAWPFSAEYLKLAYPYYTPEQITALSDRHAAVARLAVKLLVLGDLYDSAGQLNERYQAEAENYIARGEKLLGELIEEIQGTVSKTGDENEGSGVSVLTIQVGERFDGGDEYSCP